MNKNIFITGMSGGIGRFLAERLEREGHTVSGTHFRGKAANANSVFADFSRRTAIDELVGKLKTQKRGWDIVIHSIGVLTPIGPFLTQEFDGFLRAMELNFLNQAYFMQKMHPLLNQSAKVFFFSGGYGGAAKNYSAYLTAKAALEMFVEQLDREDPSVTYTSIGPGWVKTEIHKQTLLAGKNAGESFLRAKEFVETGCGTDPEEIFRLVSWLMKQDKALIGGRNFSVVWDRYDDNTFQEKLIREPSLLKWRRNAPHIS